MRKILWLFVALLHVGCSGLRSAELPRLSAELQLRAGASVADLGAGDGEITAALAKLVGATGRVFASEIDADKRAELAAARAPNVTVVVASDTATGLTRACCDAIVMRGVYHHLTQPGVILAGIVDALKAGGRFVVIDFEAAWFLPDVDGVPANRGGHGVPREVVVREARDAGLEHVQTIDDWPALWPLGPYAVVLRKPLAPAATARIPKDGPR